jgi:hypothetical protein
MEVDFNADQPGLSLSETIEARCPRRTRLLASIALKPPCFSRGIQRDTFFSLEPRFAEGDSLPSVEHGCVVKRRLAQRKQTVSRLATRSSSGSTQVTDPPQAGGLSLNEYR